MLKWSDPAPPTPNVSFYDHVWCDSPIGKIMIEWKSWKQNDSYDIIFSELSGVWLGGEYDLDDAKKKVEDYLRKLSNDIQEILK